MILPSITPEDTFLGPVGLGAGGGGGAAEVTKLPITPPTVPPGTPPTTPPMTPEFAGGGASSSTMCSIFLGILLGVRSWSFTISLTRWTTWGGAGGGGGGGGGGGAMINNAFNCPFGRASVKISGSSTKMPTSPTCTRNEAEAVHFAFVRSLPPDSIKLSSNIPVLQSWGTLQITLDTGTAYFRSEERRVGKE